jgi:hypothetical protein
MALAVQAAIFGDFGDAVHHQHRGRGKLGIAGAEQLAARAGQKGVLVEGCRKICHVPPQKLCRMPPQNRSAPLTSRPMKVQGAGLTKVCN